MVRLNEQEINVLKEQIYDLDPEAKIYLFGSRVDRDKKGGDIDLLILSDHLTGDDKITLKRKIFDYLDEQKIDLLITNDVNDPFVKLALKTGIRL